MIPNGSETQRGNEGGVYEILFARSLLIASGIPAKAARPQQSPFRRSVVMPWRGSRLLAVTKS